MCRKQELRVILGITTSGFEIGHGLHQANVWAGFKQIRIFLLNFANVLKLKSVSNLFTGTVNVTAEPQAEVHFEL